MNNRRNGKMANWFSSGNLSRRWKNRSAKWQSYLFRTKIKKSNWKIIFYRAILRGNKNIVPENGKMIFYRSLSEWRNHRKNARIYFLEIDYIKILIDKINKGNNQFNRLQIDKTRIIGEKQDSKLNARVPLENTKFQNYSLLAFN